MTKFLFGRRKRSAEKIVDGIVITADDDRGDGDPVESNSSFAPEIDPAVKQIADTAAEFVPKIVEKNKISSTEKDWGPNVVAVSTGPPADESPPVDESPPPKVGRTPKDERFFVHLKASGRAARTIKEYNYDLGWWKTVAGNQKKTLYTLLTGEIEQVIAELHPRTKARKLAALRTYARWMLREGYPKLKLELDKLSRIKMPQRLPKDLGESEFVRYRELAKQWCDANKREGVWIGLMVMGGLRISEIRTSRVNGKGVQLIGKGDKERFVPLPLWLIKAMNTITRKTRGGWAIHRGNIWRGLARNGIRKPHSLRHTYASELLRRGRTIEEIQKLLGHESISTTNIYARLHAPPDVVNDLER